MMARRVMAGRGGFSPKALFAAGEQGVWYDPSDLTTLFQDSSGTTPVTSIEQPVGLMLDKSKGLVLGPELVDSQVASTWVAEGTNTVEQDGLEVKVTYVNNPNGAYLSFTDAKALNTTLVVGKTYKISFKARVNSVADLSIYVWTGAANAGGLSSLTSTSLITYVGYFTAGSTTAAKLAIANFSSGEQVWISDVSIKELPGNHAFQSASASRPVLSARVNLLTKTEQFDDAVWGKTASSVSANATTAPDGNTTADLLIPDTASSSAHRVSVDTGLTLSNASTTSIYLKAGGYRYGALMLNDTNNMLGFDLATGTITFKGSNVNGVVDAANNGWYRFTITSNTPSNHRWAYIIVSNTAITNNTLPTWTGDGTSGIYIWGADLRVANDGVNLPAYQRVNTASDYDTVGFPAYLKFNGSNSSLSTNSINFTATDKMTVFAGVRKLSDAAGACLVELSANTNTNNGAFIIGAPNSAAADYTFRSKGTAIGQVITPASYASPITNILTSIGDLPAPISQIKINGVSAALNTMDIQGAVTYGNYPLYIGARGGSSLYFNGRLYSLIVRGAQTPANLIAATERYVARKTGVTL